MTLLLSTLALLFWQAPATQLQGVVNDVRCGATRSADCGRPGEPLDFVTDDGRVYGLDHPETAMKYAGLHVSATGTLTGALFSIAKFDVLKTPAPFCACTNPNDAQLSAEEEQRVEAAGENPEITPDGPGIVWDASRLAAMQAGAAAPAPGFAGTWAGNLLARDGLSMVSIRISLTEKSGVMENFTNGCRATLTYVRTDDDVALYQLDVTDGVCTGGNVRFRRDGKGLQWGLGTAGTLAPANPDAVPKLLLGGSTF